MGYGILNFSETLNDALLAAGDVGVKSTLKVYPNPVSSVFSVQTDEKIMSVELYDTLGRKIKSLPTEKTNTLEGLAKGVYFLKIKTHSREHIEKIIKN